MSAAVDAESVGLTDTDLRYIGYWLQLGQSQTGPSPSKQRATTVISFTGKISPASISEIDEDEMYALQDELVRDFEHRELVRHRNRAEIVYVLESNGHIEYIKPNDRFSLALDYFSRLARATVNPAVFRDETKINRSLNLTKNMQGLRNRNLDLLLSRPDILQNCAETLAELIFECKQGIDKDENTQEKFSTLKGNFLRYVPEAQHCINIKKFPYHSHHGHKKHASAEDVAKNKQENHPPQFVNQFHRNGHHPITPVYRNDHTAAVQQYRTTEPPVRVNTNIFGVSIGQSRR